VITPNYLYTIKPANYKVIRKIDLQKIHQLSIVQTNIVYLAFQVRDEFDLLIETYRRPEVIAFLREIFKMRLLPPFNRVYTNGYKFKEIAETKMAYPHLQETYKNAKYVGFLKVYKDTWISSPWADAFFVLCNVGLLQFDEPGKLKPVAFIPLPGVKIKDDEKEFKGVKNVFRLSYEGGNELLLSAASEFEKSKWVAYISSLNGDPITESMKASTRKVEELEFKPFEMKSDPEKQ
jgi:hypothetical protein